MRLYMDKIKLKNIQVVLFFKNEIEYNSLKLANTVSERMLQLGQPNIFNLPQDIPNEIRTQAPRIIFNNAKEINVTISASTLNLNMIGQNTIEEVVSNTSSLYEALKEQNIQIKAIGFVCDYIIYNVDFEKIKHIYYKDELESSELVNASWFNKENELNVWKMLNVTDDVNKKVLNIRIDVNNRNNSDSIIEKENISTIIRTAFEKAMEFKTKISSKIGE